MLLEIKPQNNTAGTNVYILEAAGGGEDWFGLLVVLPCSNTVTERGIRAEIIVIISVEFLMRNIYLEKENTE